MRVRGGSAKGQVIQAPKGFDTRPTSDKVKEAIFNVLAFKIQEAEVIDLCAGSGNLGLESLSRGAKKAVFVEKHSKACMSIKHNITNLDFQTESKIHKIDVLKALSLFVTKEQKFDIIFFDPPYHAGLYLPVLNFIALNGTSLLKENAVLVVECSVKENLPDIIDEFILRKTSVYGDTKVLYYQF